MSDPRRLDWTVLLSIGAGGAVGAAARWGVSQAAPAAPGRFPWATFGVNVSGCLVLGVLMVFVVDVWPPRRYVRPFLGVGVLGGYTTFSTYMLEARSLVVGGEQGLAAVYLLGSLLAGLLAVWVAIVATRAAVRRRRHRRTGHRSPARGGGGMTLLLVIAGAFVGAPLRYLTDRFVQSRHRSVLPWGTFTVNVAGSLVLGAVMGASTAADWPSWVAAVAGTGFCGALTTFSTFGFENVRLIEDGSVLEAFANIVTSLLAGLVAVFCGWALATALVAALS